MQKRKVLYLIFQGQSSETKDIPVWYEAYFKSQNAARMQRLRSQSEFRDKMPTIREKNVEDLQRQ